MNPADADLLLPPVPPAKRLSLDEPIVGSGGTFGEFLGWAYSDVLDSMSRGTLAEYLVVRALGLDLDPRNPGDTYDLRYRGGIQVKASSAAQRWPSDKVHRISFGTSPSRAYGPEFYTHGTVHASDLRGACWIFAVHQPSSRDPDTARREILDVSTWFFWIGGPLATRRSQTPLLHVIANRGLGVGYHDLRTAVDRCMDAAASGEVSTWNQEPDLDDWRQEELMHILPSSGVDAIVEAVAAIQAAYPARVQIRLSPGEIGVLFDRRKAVVLDLNLVELVDNAKLNFRQVDTSARPGIRNEKPLESRRLIEELERVLRRYPGDV